MKREIKQVAASGLSLALALTLSIGALTPSLTAAAAPETPSAAIVINEVESDGDTTDWVEICNLGTTDVDISGWYVLDNDPTGHAGDTTPLAEGSVLAPGEFYVFEGDRDFTFGLGKADTAGLYSKDGTLVDSFSWTGHAAGTYARQEDGTFADQAATKGAANTVTPEPELGVLVINEINSSPDDWVEVMNVGTDVMDLSGYELRDNSDDHRWQFASGTTLAAGARLLVSASTEGLRYNDTTGAFSAGTFDLGLGSGDSVRIYDAAGVLLDSYSWTGHASYAGDAAAASFGRYPDGTGSFVLMPETPDAANSWYAPAVVINEVESNGDATDWVEIYNTGDTAVDISGWYLLDNDPTGHAGDVTPVPAGTTLAAGGYYVFEQNTDFTFGLGKGDEATIYTGDGAVVAQYAWSSHADGVYARIPNGTGELVDFATATKGKANLVTNAVVLNEIQSKDPDGGFDWIELANPTDGELDISGLVLKDSDDAHTYTIPAGTTIAPKGFLVLTEDVFGFGLGKDDQVRIFEGELLIAQTTWSGNTEPTWGLYPDVNGSEYRATKTATPGAANLFDGIPEVIAWPGSDTVSVFDDSQTFLTDSSGLDFADGKLYAVDNGTATVWVLDVAADGALSVAAGFENGKRIQYQKDAGNTGAPGPDTEGITADGSGYVYLASERDNAAKGVNYNVILKADLSTAGDTVTAAQEWDLTASLPQVSANMGIEAVEWVSNADVTGVLFDQNTGSPFDPADYPNATAAGVFFVALEDNGHVYAYVLNADSSVVQIADIDSKLGGAMALDYDSYEGKLWVAADNGYANLAATIVFNATANPLITHVLPAAGLDTGKNYEGFAIADASFTVNGQRPVYHFEDGVSAGSLVVGSLNCGYTVSYTITEGANASRVQGSAGNLTFRADGDITLFSGVRVDGNSVPSDGYTTASGSTVVTLNAAYLDTLAVGSHTLTVLFTNGSASAAFSIAQAADYTAVDAAIAKIPADLSGYTAESVQALTNACNAVLRDKSLAEQDVVDGYVAAIESAIAALVKSAASPAADSTSTGESTTSPKTGDGAEPLIWSTLLATGGAALTVLLVLGRQKKSERQ